MSVSSDASLTESLRATSAPTEGQAPPRQVVPPVRTAPTDGELLTLFTRHGDRAAFDRLIDRHAAMVWRVCRQSLRRQQDAEDAFQATFLMLVKSARQVRSSDSAAGWLYRVAYRNSIRARKKLAARREESLSLDPLAPSEAAFPDLLRKQTASVLLEELGKLPERYQTPLVMRYLEGQSRRAIADQTDTTIAAVQGQLARGKQLLRRRLLRRGVSLSVAMTAVTARSQASGSQAADAGVPTHVVTQTTTNSVAIATGGSLAASATVVSLYQEGVRAMLLLGMAKPAGLAATVAAVALLVMVPGASGEKLTANAPTLRADLSEVSSADEDFLVQIGVALDLSNSDRPDTPLAPEPPVAKPTVSGILNEIANTGTRIELARSPADLAEGEKGWIETQRRYYTARAVEDGITDYQEPSFAELLKLNRYWVQKKHNAREERERLNEQGMRMNHGTSKDERAALSAEMNRNIADWNLAQAKIAELERELKRAAIAEADQSEPEASARTVEPAAEKELERLLKHKERLLTAQKNFVMYGDKNSEENIERRKHIQRINKAINAVQKQITLTAAPDAYLTAVLERAAVTDEANQGEPEAPAPGDVPDERDPLAQATARQNGPSEGNATSRTPPSGVGGSPVDDATKRSESMNRLRELGLALLNYEAEHDHFPSPDVPITSARPLLSWRVAVLPYLGEQELYDRFRHNEPWNSPHNMQLVSKMPEAYHDPRSSHPRHDGKTNYVAATGRGAFFQRGKQRHFLDVRDGVSTTIALVEVHDTQATTWTRPADFDLDAYPRDPRSGIGSFSWNGEFLATLVDGSVKAIRREYPSEQLRRMLLIDDQWMAARSSYDSFQEAARSKPSDEAEPIETKASRRRESSEEAPGEIAVARTPLTGVGGSPSNAARDARGVEPPPFAAPQPAAAPEPPTPPVAPVEPPEAPQPPPRPPAPPIPPEPSASMKDPPSPLTPKTVEVRGSLSAADAAELKRRQPEVLVEAYQQSTFADVAGPPLATVTTRLPVDEAKELETEALAVERNAAAGRAKAYELKRDALVAELRSVSMEKAAFIRRAKQLVLADNRLRVEQRGAEALHERVQRGEGFGEPSSYTTLKDAYGHDVTKLQQRLYERLEPTPGLDVDGDYGKATALAVARFQRGARLPATGFADATTRKALGMTDPLIDSPIQGVADAMNTDDGLLGLVSQLNRLRLVIELQLRKEVHAGWTEDGVDESAEWSQFRLARLQAGFEKINAALSNLGFEEELKFQPYSLPSHRDHEAMTLIEREPQRAATVRE